MQFAERAALDFRSVDDAFVTELRRHFSDAEIAELGMMVQQYIALGRLLVMAGGDKMRVRDLRPARCERVYASHPGTGSPLARRNSGLNSLLW